MKTRNIVLLSLFLVGLLVAGYFAAQRSSPTPVQTQITPTQSQQNARTSADTYNNTQKQNKKNTSTKSPKGAGKGGGVFLRPVRPSARTQKSANTKIKSIARKHQRKSGKETDNRAADINKETANNSTTRKNTKGSDRQEGRKPDSATIQIDRQIAAYEKQLKSRQANPMAIHQIIRNKKLFVITDSKAREDNAGATVTSVAAGTVTKSGQYTGRGESVEILHDDGYRSSYLFLSKRLVNAGDKVVKGQAIGKIRLSKFKKNPVVRITSSIKLPENMAE